MRARSTIRDILITPDTYWYNDVNDQIPGENVKYNKEIEKAILIDLLLNGSIHAIANTVSITSLSSERITSLLKKDELSIEDIVKANTTINNKFIILRDQLQAFQLYNSNYKEKTNVSIIKVMAAANFFSAYLLNSNNLTIDYLKESLPSEDIMLSCNASDMIYFLSRVFVEIFNHCPDYSKNEDKLFIKFGHNDNNQFIFETDFGYDHQKAKIIISSIFDSELDIKVLEFNKDKIILQYDNMS